MTDNRVVTISEDTDYVVAPHGELYSVFLGELVLIDPEEDPILYSGYEKLINTSQEGDQKQEITNPVTG